MTDALEAFRCCKDTDIEKFLHNKALDFLDRKLCAIYLILDEQKFDKGYIDIVAYFSLSYKSLIPCNASKNQIKEADGFKEAKSIHFVLIGQLGKYMSEENNQLITKNISSKEILDYAFEIIRASSYLIPCRCTLVECSDNKKIHKVYENYGFKYFQQDGKHFQFIKRI